MERTGGGVSRRSSGGAKTKSACVKRKLAFFVFL